MTQTLTRERDCQPAIEKPTEYPFVLEFFMVAGAGFRGMAYRDKDGRWHNARTHEVLRGDIFVLE